MCIRDRFKQCLKKLSTDFYLINSALDSGYTLRLSLLDALLSDLGNYSYHSGLPCED